MNWNNYPNFKREEFSCKHTGLNEMKPEFMKKLQELRTAYGKALHINSGYRHPTHPVEARKGHANGEHTKGLCCDVRVTNSSERFAILKLAFEVGFTRIGFHNGFIHLGVGDGTLPNNVFWDYK
jgi:zinc D-Ala-D-Ala carboxypeptidase